MCPGSPRSTARPDRTRERVRRRGRGKRSQASARASIRGCSEQYRCHGGPWQDRPVGTHPLNALIVAGGLATLASFAALAITEAMLGSPLFFVCIAIPCIVYALLAW